MHPKYISINDYTYTLPEEKIAYYPLANRDEAKLLIYTHGSLNQDIYKNISHYIPAQSLMIFNNTKVVEARLLFQKETGGVIEIFCLEPHEMYRDIATAMSQRGSVKWLCLIGGVSKWKKELDLTLKFNTPKSTYTLKAKYVDKRKDCYVIELMWDNTLSFAEVLHYAGHVPLPPYIKRADETADKNRYQTVFAKYDGSVAAPTAGLHFTPSVLSNLTEKNILTDFVTLHVGAGTFKPVKADTLQDHEMHSEYITVSKGLIEHLMHPKKPIIAVGTTSLRTLESLYWLGCKLIQDPAIFNTALPYLTQWASYSETTAPPISHAFQAILQYLQNTGQDQFIAKTQIIIAPGYEFKIVDGLITNFHQPNSTLLLLVAAFIGLDWKKVYEYALQNEFRFLSYGDGSLLWKNHSN